MKRRINSTDTVSCRSCRQHTFDASWSGRSLGPWTTSESRLSRSTVKSSCTCITSQSCRTCSTSWPRWARKASSSWLARNTCQMKTRPYCNVSNNILKICNSISSRFSQQILVSSLVRLGTNMNCMGSKGHRSRS